MRKNWLGLVVLGLGLGLAACSQALEKMQDPEARVTPQFGTAHYDVGTSVFVNQDLNAVFVGGLYNSRIGLDSDQLFIRRYTRNGGLWFAKKVLASEDRNFQAIAKSPDNALIGVVSTGKATDVYKYSASGQLLWQQKIGFGYASMPQTDAAGNVYVFTEPSGNYLTKYDNQGKKILEASIPFDEPQAVAPDGSIYIMEYGLTVSKYSPQLKLQWTKSLAKGSYIATDLVVDAKSLHFAGIKNYLADGDVIETDALIGKADINGKLTWLKSFGSTRTDNANDLTLDSQGNVYVTGRTDGNLAEANTGTADVFVRKYAPSGAVVWTKQYGTAGYDEGNGIALMNSGELYLTGDTGGNLGAGYKGGNDAFLMRLDGNGNKVWVR